MSFVGLPDSRDYAGAVTDSAGAAIPVFQTDLATAQLGLLATDAFTKAASTTAFGAAAFLAIALIATLFVRPARVPVVPNAEAVER